jgi:hypothetical protein
MVPSSISVLLPVPVPVMYNALLADPVASLVILALLYMVRLLPVPIITVPDAEFEIFAVIPPVRVIIGYQLPLKPTLSEPVFNPSKCMVHLLSWRVSLSVRNASIMDESDDVLAVPTTVPVLLPILAVYPPAVPFLLMTYRHSPVSGKSTVTVPESALLVLWFAPSTVKKFCGTPVKVYPVLAVRVIVALYCVEWEKLEGDPGLQLTVPVYCAVSVILVTGVAANTGTVTPGMAAISTTVRAADVVICALLLAVPAL